MKWERRKNKEKWKKRSPGTHGLQGGADCDTFSLFYEKLEKGRRVPTITNDQHPKQLAKQGRQGRERRLIKIQVKHQTQNLHQFHFVLD